MTDPNGSDRDDDLPSARVPSTVVVFTGGDPMRREVAPLLPDDAYVIAADSGLHTRARRWTGRSMWSSVTSTR